jgi:hypothetical protein
MVACMSGVRVPNILSVYHKNIRTLKMRRGEPFAILGTLDGTVAPPMPTNFSSPHRTAWSPLKLQLPSPTRSVR